jgi:exopolyphosphatase / guanosine-5'-triphosphate,3'-diphosphate pyrophosphatase
MSAMRAEDLGRVLHTYSRIAAIMSEASEVSSGGGSLELACGVDEEPELAESVPLGAGRLTRERLRGDPPCRDAVSALRTEVDRILAAPAERVRALGHADRVAGTSKAFRSLARLAGAAPSSAGPTARRELTASGLRQIIGFISRIPAADLAQLEGVRPARAHQLLAGAVVAEACMRALRLDVIEVCPWALREGLILRRLDSLSTASGDNVIEPDAAVLLPPSHDGSRLTVLGQRGVI